MDTTIETSTVNISIMDCSKEDLQVEYHNLKKSHLSAQKELETQRQQIYDLRRELKRFAALEQHYQQEVEALQSLENAAREKLNQLTASSEKELASVRSEHREQIAQLEAVISESMRENERLVSELKQNAKIAEVGVGNAAFEKDSAENDRLREEVELLSEMTKESSERIITASKEIDALKHTLKNLETDYAQMKENYNGKKTEVEELQCLNETMQVEMSVLRANYDALRANPLDEAMRGNSLFAEVNDRRVQLQRNFNVMKEQYLGMRDQQSKLLAQITALEGENVNLTRRWKLEIEDKQHCERFVNNMQRNRIRDLEEINKQLGALLEERMEWKEVIDNRELEFVYKLIENKEMQIKKLLESLDKESMLKTILSRDMEQTKDKLRKWKVTSYELESEISLLKTELESVKLKNPAASCAECEQRKNPTVIDKIQEAMKRLNKQPEEKKTEQKKITELSTNHVSILRETNATRKEDKVDGIIKEEPKDSVEAEKENTLNQITAEKKVTFHEDVVDMVNARKPRRMGRKVTCPVTYVPEFVPKK